MEVAALLYRCSTTDGLCALDESRAKTDERMTDERRLLTARLAATRVRLWRELIGIDERTLTTLPVIADWTAKDLLAHVGDYDLLHAMRIQLALDGRIEQAEIDYTLVRNETLRNRVQGWSLDQTVAYCVTARTAFLDALSHVSEVKLTRPYRFFRMSGWAKGSIRDWTEWALQA